MDVLSEPIVKAPQSTEVRNAADVSVAKSSITAYEYRYPPAVTSAPTSNSRNRPAARTMNYEGW
jgi:hypothetical protein